MSLKTMYTLIQNVLLIKIVVTLRSLQLKYKSFCNSANIKDLDHHNKQTVKNIQVL